MLPIIFLAPVFQLIVLGYAANLDVKNILMVVVDQDKSSLSRQFISEFSNSGYFIVKQYLESSKQIDEYLDTGKASMALVIPVKFSEHLLQNRPAEVQLIVDGSESAFATAGLQYATLITIRFSQKLVLKIFERLKYSGLKISLIEPRVRIWYNPELKSKNFMVPGVLALLLMIMTGLLTALAIVKEKEMGTMEQLIVTPIRSSRLIIGKLAPFVLISLIDVLLVILVARFWFRVPIKGSIILLFALCLVFLLTTLGLGLFISTVSKTQQQAMMITQFFVMLPMIYLSGFAFPIENMPRVIQYVTYLLPLRYFIVIVRGIFLKGSGIEELWKESIILLFFGIVILSLSIIRFQKKLE